MACSSSAFIFSGALSVTSAMLLLITRVIMWFLSVVVYGQGVRCRSGLTGQYITGLDFIGSQRLVFIHFELAADYFGATGSADAPGARKWGVWTHPPGCMQHGFYA